MKYSFSWLKELSGTKKTPQQVVELLTMRSMEVEGVERIGGIPDGVIVGKILEIEKHPNADKLQVVKVNIEPSPRPLPSPPLITGEGVSGNVLQIVCGAWNIKVGDNVPVATVGTILPGNFEIKEAEIRGVKSFGMLCAEDELGLGTDHSGILILPKKAKVGEKVSKYLGSGDTIIEIKVLPDRAHDCLSHVGVAREICALENKSFDYDFEGLKLPKKKTENLKVEIKDKKLCPRYIGAVMTDVEIKPSPKWMQERLKSCGIKAINNVVDATNYVMLELGQPLHAFDFSKISGKISNKKNQISNLAYRQAGKLQNSNVKCQISVRRAEKNERMSLLDGNEINLTENDLLITNGGTPLALAGIMGGANSAIDENTKTIVLEAASFNAVNIRRSRTRLNIKTESSDRFEKDLDPNLCEKAMVRLIEILEHTACAKLEGIVDEYPRPAKLWKIKLGLDYVNDLLGEKISGKETVRILKSLSFKVLGRGKTISVEAPTFRLDAKTQEDLIEEIGRVRGYDKIEAQPMREPVYPAKINEQVFFEKKVKNILVGLGADEAYNYSFYSKRDAEICGLDEVAHYELANPMSPEQEFVRVSLVPNVLKNVRENLKYFEGFEIFEIGRVYYPNNNQVEEKRMLVMAKVLSDDKKAETFYSLKGDLENLLESLNAEGKFGEDKRDIKLIHSGRSAEIKISGKNIGVIAEVNPQILRQYKIKKRVACVEVDLEKLHEVLPQEKTYSQISKFPTVTRDISLLSPKGVTVAEIIDLIKKIGGNLVKKVGLFDIFQKDTENSYAFHITFGSPDRTLESGEVDKLVGKITSDLNKNLKVEIRK